MSSLFRYSAVRPSRSYKSCTGCPFDRTYSIKLLANLVEKVVHMVKMVNHQGATYTSHSRQHIPTLAF